MFEKKAKQATQLISLLISAVVFACCYLSATPQARAATLTVTKTADTNDGVCNADCSLREAISAAASGDTIAFSSLFNNTQQINLTGTQLLISKSLTISGTGARLLTISGNNSHRVFRIDSGAGSIVNISALTIANGSESNSGENGGGIQLFSGITLNLMGVAVRNNLSDGGAGIYSQGNLNIVHSAINNNSPDRFAALWIDGGTANIANTTIAGNHAGSAFGGIFVTNGGMLSINNATITNNSGQGTGGIRNQFGTVNIRNTIVAQNLNQGTAPDVSGTFNSSGNNLIGANDGAEVSFPAGNPNVNGDRVGTFAAPINPQLGTLQNNGGPTDTRALLAGSPAINNGNNCVAAAGCSSNNPATALTTDQRGSFYPRQLEAAVDIGAFESGVGAIVTNTNDSGAGSLRQAINDAPANTAVVFDIPIASAGCAAGICTITLTSAELGISKNLTIIGSGARSVIIQRSPAAGTPNFRIFNITGSGNTVNISGVAIAGGNPGNNGGGVQNAAGNVLNLTEVTVRNNTGTLGGGIINLGTLSIIRSTFNHNTATTEAGGLRNNGTASIINSTLSDNTSSNNGGGIIDFGDLTLINSTISSNTGNVAGGVFKASGGALNIRNTIIAANISGNGGNRPDVFGNFTSWGNNLIGNNNGSTGFMNGDIVGTSAAPINPQLGSLQNNGGPVDTRALLSRSPALNRGNNCVINLSCSSHNAPFALTTDQRGTGFPRVFSNFVDVGAFELQIIVRRAPFDFDGDNKTDVSIFRAADGSWWYLRSSDNQFRVFTFGLGSDIIAPGDYTGDGRADIAIFRPSSGEWFIQRSDDNSFFSFPFGTNGDVPVPADYDGDGKTDAAIFRPSTGTWFILNSGGTGTGIVNFGGGADKPVPADYDGDGRADIAIFRPSDGSWWYLRSIDLQFRVYRFGVGTDIPVQGDYSGDGRAELAVFRPATGEWFFQRSEDNSYYSLPFGAGTDIPSPGDYDGDGRFDMAVFRPSTGNWFMQGSTSGTIITSFGGAGDRPIPNAFVP